MENFLKVMLMLFLIVSFPGELLAQWEHPTLVSIAENQVTVATKGFSTWIAIIDAGDPFLNAEVSFSILYDPEILAVDTTQGSPGFPGVEARGRLTINRVDPSLPGRLVFSGTIKEHMEILVFYWVALGSGYNVFEIKPGPENSYFSTIGAKLVVLPQVPGDVDNNRSIDIIDALQIAVASVTGNADNLSLESADVDGNGEINIVDALMVARYYVKLLPDFPAGDPLLRQVLFVNLKKKNGPLDGYTFDQLGEVILTPPGEIVSENSYFILPQNSEVFVEHRLLLDAIQDGLDSILFRWKSFFTWPAEDRETGRIFMDIDKQLTAYYYTGDL